MLLSKTDFFLKVIDELPVIVWALDKNGKFILGHGKSIETLGLEPGQVLGLSVFDLYKDFPEALKTIRQNLAGKTTISETVHDGIWFQNYS